MNKIRWKFDMLIYRLFYWRWNKRFINDMRLRRLFISYLEAWDNEPTMGTPPKFPEPQEKK